MSTLPNALRYALAGYPVLPLLAKSKDPDTDLVPHAVKDATTDRDTIRAWWKRCPESNLGIAMGHGHVALDVDRPGESHGEEAADGFASLAKLEKTHGETEKTLAFRTGGDGMQLIFTAPAGTANATGREGELGLGLRAQNLYIVGPGSIHPDTGREYVEVEGQGLGEVNPAPLPAWLPEVLGNGKTFTYTSTGKAGPPAKAPQFKEGGRNNGLTHAAGKYRRQNMSPSALESALLVENQERCVPPLPDEEVRQIARSVGRYAPAETSKLVDRSAPLDPEDASDLPPIVSVGDLLAKTFAEPVWAIEGLFPEGLTLLTGKPKAGKSWMGLSIAIAVAAGGKALGKYDVARGGALYLGLEDSERRLQDRVRDIIADGTHGDVPLDFATEWPRFCVGGLTMLERYLDQQPDTKVVVIDTLARLRDAVSRNADKYQADYEAVGPLQRIAIARGVAIIVVHHLRKADSDDPLDLVSGTLGLTGAADTIAVLRRENRQNAEATMFVTGRDTEDMELALRFDALTMQWVALGDAHEVQMSKERHAVIDALTDREPMTPKELAEDLGKNASTMRGILRKMRKAGEVTVMEGNRYAVAFSTPATP